MIISLLCLIYKIKIINNTMFYLYPMDNLKINIKWNYDKFFYERWIKEAYNALLENPFRTDNPDEALALKATGPVP